MIPLTLQPQWMARSASLQILSQDGGQLESGGLRPDGSLSLLVSETAHPDLSRESPVDLEHLLNRLLLRHSAAAIGEATQ